MTTRTLFLLLGASLLLACGSSVSSGGTSSHGTGGAGTGGAAGTGGKGGGTGVGAGGSAGVGGGCASAPTFAEVLAKPLSGCSGLEPPCHNASAGELHIDPADAASSWAALVDVDAFIAGAGKRVVPGDPAHSFLYRKLVGDLGPDDGVPMPKSGLATGWMELPEDELDLVRCWILAGAKND